jgi:hypothetical protein
LGSGRFVTPLPIVTRRADRSRNARKPTTVELTDVDRV